MSDHFSVPEEFEIPLRRIIPYLSAPLQNDPKVIESLLLYFKLGGEKMARIVIDALNVTHRIQHAEMVRRMREEAMIRENLSEEGGESEESEESEDDKDDKDDNAEKDSGDDNSENL